MAATLPRWSVSEALWPFRTWTGFSTLPTTGDNTYGQLGYANTADETDSTIPYKNNYATMVRFEDAEGEVLEQQPVLTAVAAGQGMIHPGGHHIGVLHVNAAVGQLIVVIVILDVVAVNTALPSLPAPHNWFGSTAENDPLNIELVGVMAGEYHSMAMDKDGKLYAWGWNGYGQLGVTRTGTLHLAYPDRVDMGAVGGGVIVLIAVAGGSPGGGVLAQLPAGILAPAPHSTVRLLRHRR